MKLTILFSLFLFALPAMAQLPAPNAAGATAGHEIFSAKDPDAANRFWAALGGEPATLVRLKLIKFPGELLLVGAQRNANGGAGTEGSTVDYIAFKVKNLKDSVAKVVEAGAKALPGATATQAFVMAPDDVKVRLREDRTLTTPVAADGLGMVVTDVAAAQAWYAKWFGGKTVKTPNGEMVSEIPGSNLYFTENKTPMAPTQGRAFGRIGMEVKGVEAFCKKLEDSGVTLVTKYTKAGNMDLAICALNDPWGTQIEVSEGLAAVK
jgi:catechol 2,3-dioxygenase-like lactoylglutathione lyase family enzyme/predicted enzyme related to lactoylglutathione lyase